MGCDLYRQLLLLRRPGGPDELSAEDNADLDRHLAGCPGCAAVADRDAGWDRAVRQAMTAVAPPAGLRARIIATAEVKRAAAFRRTVGRYAALAAAVLVALPLGYGVYLRTRPVLDGADLAERSSRAVEDPTAEVREFLETNRLPVSLPQRFDLHGCRAKVYFKDVNGVKLPCIDLTRRGGPQDESLQILIVSRDRFRIDDFRPAASSFATVTADPVSVPGWAYVYISTSPTLDPFLLPPGGGV
jgi:hypothetical protein